MNSDCNLLPPSHTDGERRLIIWRESLVFGALGTSWLVSQRGAPSYVCSGDKHFVGAPSEYLPFPIYHSPLQNHTLSLSTQLLISLGAAPPPRLLCLSCSSVSNLINVQCAFWAKALLISWRHWAVFQFYSEWKVNADVLGFGSPHPPSWLKILIVTYLNKVVPSEQLMIKSLHKMWKSLNISNGVGKQ